jgi:hypothetical protein
LKKKPDPEKFICTAKISKMNNFESVINSVVFALANAGYDTVTELLLENEEGAIQGMVASTKDEPNDEVNILVDMDNQTISLEFGNYEEEGGYSRFRAIFVSKVFYNTIGTDLCNYGKKVIKFSINDEDEIPAKVDFLDKYVGKDFKKIYNNFVDGDIDL